jgi:oligopeptide/dipeptide ABC transporter ATP-binding protein
MKADTPLLTVDRLEVRHHRRGGAVHAVNGVSFSLDRGQTLGLVGESGCGKSTLAKTIMGLNRASAGRIRFAGRDITPGGGWLRTRRKAVTEKLQMVFQDPLTSLNPRSSVGRIVEEPLIVHRKGDRAERARRVAELLSQVGLSPQDAERMPHEFSGGQRQRIGIARALALTPELIVCDEPVSALDLSVQAQVLNLLGDLQAGYHLSYLFISHDLNVVRYMADQVIVMYLGTVVESGPAAVVWEQPRHPYTEALMAAVAGNRRNRARSLDLAPGELPSAFATLAGCPFYSRCPRREARCAETLPLLRSVGQGQAAACHLA